MALFEYFPNYVWNLSIAMALESGAKIGEIIDMCQPIREAAAAGSDAGTPQFLAQWVVTADRLVGLADEDAARGRAFSASDKLERAALYFLVAERMQARGAPGRDAIYAQARQAPYGARITIGPRSRSGACSAKVSTPCRTTGRTCTGLSVHRIWNPSWRRRGP
jgi:hypothetical protein